MTAAGPPCLRIVAQKCDEDAIALTALINCRTNAVSRIGFCTCNLGGLLKREYCVRGAQRSLRGSIVLRLTFVAEVPSFANRSIANEIADEATVGGVRNIFWIASSEPI